ncbi:MAG: hypothetical protein OHK0015_11840 [Chloroflexi bacterium OHK40]
MDVGCGNGSLVAWLQSVGYAHAEGIDVSAEQIEEARRLNVWNVQQASLKPYLSTRHFSYDVIVMRDVLEHFAKDEVLDILDCCYAALRPGGRLIAQVPNAESPFFGRIRYGDFTHDLAFSVTSLQQIFAVVGFDELAMHPVEPAIISVRSALRYPLWRAVSALYQMLLFAELGPGRRIVTQGIIVVATKGAPRQEM